MEDDVCAWLGACGLALFLDFAVLLAPGVDSELTGRGTDPGVFCDPVLRVWFSGCIPAWRVSVSVWAGRVCTAGGSHDGSE